MVWPSPLTRERTVKGYKTDGSGGLVEPVRPVRDTVHVPFFGVGTSSETRMSSAHGITQFAGSEYSESLGYPTYPALGTNGIHAVDYAISGTGNVTDETMCGTWSRSYACSNDASHFLKSVKHHCDNPSCPVCFGSWTSKAAKRIAERVRGYITAATDTQVDLDGFELASWHKDNSRYLNHYMLSPRDGEITPYMPYNAIKQRGRAMAARIGITGAVQLFHPYRIKKKLHSSLVRVCRGAVHMTE